ncbi:MAG: hypothetical protein ABIA67_06525 [Candidatus Margulisiibacteriota bacterium]
MENSILIQSIATEYQKGKSAKEVGESLGLSERKVRYLMQKTGMKARSWSEATYCKRNPKGNPFEIIEQIKKPKDLELFFVSLGLYLGEGTKKGDHVVALGNTNPGILKTFLNFLRIICKVKDRKIYAELNIFDDVNSANAVSYWVDSVGIKKDQILYITSRKSKGGTYKNKSKYGTLTIKVNNSKLKRIVLDWCNRALKDCLAPL